MMITKPVNKLKKYNHIEVANVMADIGYRWRGGPKARPHNIEKMLEGLPKIELERILKTLQFENVRPMGARLGAR